jgi:anti-sigma regulatory factor (Ser/Thr protein kinase)
MVDEFSSDGQPPNVSSGWVETTAMERAAISGARHLIVEQVRKWQCANVDDAALVLSELVTNAVVHAGGAVRIAVTPDGDHVRIEVHDHESEQPNLRAYSANPGGLGLHIVDQLSERWGSQPTGTGKFVWAVVACARQPTGG